MTKKQYSKICALYKDGVSSELCIGMIIACHETTRIQESVKWIEKFYMEVVLPTWTEVEVRV